MFLQCYVISAVVKRLFVFLIRRSIVIHEHGDYTRHPEYNIVPPEPEPESSPEPEPEYTHSPKPEPESSAEPKPTDRPATKPGYGHAGHDHGHRGHDTTEPESSTESGETVDDPDTPARDKPRPTKKPVPTKAPLKNSANSATYNIALLLLGILLKMR